MGPYCLGTTSDSPLKFWGPRPWKINFPKEEGFNPTSIYNFIQIFCSQ
jgi:hypothetical protein